MNNWIETSGSPFVIVEQQYAHQWKGQENYNAICSVTDYLGENLYRQSCLIGNGR